MTTVAPPDESCPCGSRRDFTSCCADAEGASHRLTSEALERWAGERGVREQLLLEAGEALRDQPRLVVNVPHWMRSMLSIGQLLAPGHTIPSAQPNGVRTFRLAAWAFLRDEAALVREGRAAEVRPAVPPAHPTLVMVFDRLRDLRAKVRETASPRPVERLPFVQLRLEPEARRLTATGDRKAWRRNYAGVSPTVVLELARAREAPLAVPDCTCGAATPCMHVLAAIDLAMAQLADPGRPVTWDALARALDTPDWSRALSSLDHLRLERQREAVGDVRLRYSFVLLGDGGSRVVVVPYLHRRRRDGEFGKGKRLSRQALAHGPGPCAPEDRVALARMGFLSQRREAFSFASSYDAYLSHESRRPEDLLRLAGHPRVFRALSDPEPLSVRPAELGLNARRSDGGGSELVPTLDGRPVPVDGVAKCLAEIDAGASFVWTDRERAEVLVVKVADPDAMGVVIGNLARFGQHFPPEAESALLDLVGSLQAVVPVTVSPELEGEEATAATQHVLRLALLDAGLELQLLARPLEGAPLHAPGEGPARVVSSSGGRRVFAVRDLETERRTAAELIATLRLAAARPTGPSSWAIGDDAEALALLDELRQLERPDLTVEWVGPPARVVRASTAKQLRVEVRDRHDWFGLAGTVEVDGEEVDLAVLLEALRDRRKIVRLKGGAWLTLTAELAERLAPLAQLSTPVAGGLEIGPAAIGPLDDLARDGAVLDARGAFARLHSRMREASKRTPRVPRAFKGKLRDYQVEGFRWLARLAAWGAGAVLADDMGLGKTLQALALLCHRAADGPALVIAPTSVCANWVAEASRFAPSLRVALFREADRASAVKGLGPGDVLVISYGLLALDLQRFVGKRFATVVLDEAQAVKNAGTRRAQAGRALEADFTVALSGTPVENHLGELWSILRVAFPGLLGSWEQFRTRFARPIEEDGDLERRRALAATIRPFLLRRTKAEVAPELPTRTEIALPVAPSGGERRLYEQARLAAVARLVGAAERVRPEQRRFQILTAITELRLLACHPRLYEPSSALPSSKLARFVELAAELVDGGHRALVFSQFTSHLALVREALDAAGVSYLYLDGQTPPARRDQLVARFQAGEGEMFLISLKAGGTGLNLTAADYVIHLDPWWNPAVEDQATDRAHRIGQTRPVTVYRLVSQGTIEETILALHEKKRALVAGILDGMDGAAKVSADDLMALIRMGPSPAEAPADAAVAAERDDR
jgi:superfamily II DNA or RNA helicase